jgi:hypothetical protein
VAFLSHRSLPEIREFLLRLPRLLRDFAWALRDLIARQSVPPRSDSHSTFVRHSRRVEFQ